MVSTDVTARYVSREDAHGNPTEDARLTVGASPVSLRRSLSAERVATLARVASATRGGDGVGAHQTESRVFAKYGPATRRRVRPRAPSLRRGRAERARVGAAAWSVWRPNPPAGYASLGDGFKLDEVKPRRPRNRRSSFAIRPRSPRRRFDSNARRSLRRTPRRVSWRGDRSRRRGSRRWEGVRRRRTRGRGNSTRCDAFFVELVAAADGVRGRCAAGVGAPPLWILENRTKTCETSADGVAAPRARLDLRVPTGLPGESRTENATERAASERAASERAASESVSPQREAPSRGTPSRGTSPATMTAVAFRRVWWDYNSGANSRLSVWRPICPPGWCSLGDVAVPALEPPASTLLVRRDDGAGDDPRPVAAPVGYERAWRDSGWRATRKKGGTASF